MTASKRSLKPDLLCEVKGAAVPQQPSTPSNTPSNGKCGLAVTEAIDMSTGYTPIKSPRRVDRWLDIVVRAGGSTPTFLVLMVALLSWALLGIRYGNSDPWISAISDFQAILCYVFDSLLMRQLLRGYTEQRVAMVQILSRSHSHNRMLLKIKQRLGSEGISEVVLKCEEEPLVPLDHALRSQSLSARAIIWLAHKLGHIFTVIIYWICICIWIAFGPMCNWTDRWQLYINEATSALMVVVFSLLACLRERHSDSTNTDLDTIFQLDSALESGLRRLSDDNLPNEPEIDLPSQENYLQKMVYYYADIIGTLVGIVILIAVMVAWASVGHIFQFNDTWWLLIGTYAGLVGLFDSFVLRNIQHKVHEKIRHQVHIQEAFDRSLFGMCNVQVPEAQPLRISSFSRRVSRKMDVVSSHILMVAAGFAFTIGCLVSSCILRWSMTGQLISNVPPSIVETFFMLILITGQNDLEVGARIDLTNIYYRRQRLLSFMRHTADYLEAKEQESAPRGAY